VYRSFLYEKCRIRKVNPDPDPTGTPNPSESGFTSLQLEILLMENASHFFSLLKALSYGYGTVPIAVTLFIATFF
jgi:hypothetical protein